MTEYKITLRSHGETWSAEIANRELGFLHLVKAWSRDDALRVAEAWVEQREDPGEAISYTPLRDRLA